MEHAPMVRSPQEMRRSIRQFCVTQFFLGVFTASTLYTSKFLMELGLTPVEVALFTSIRSIFGIVTPFIWGLASDRFRTVKKVFLICLLGVLMFYPTLPLTRFIPLGAITLAPVMTIFVHFFYRPLDFIYSNWLIHMVKRIPTMDYGRLRIFSSIASTLAGVLFAYLIKTFGTVSVSYYVGGATCFILLFTIRPLPDIRPDDAQPRMNFRDLQLSRLLKGPLLVMFGFLVIANIPNCSMTMSIPYLLKVIEADTSVLAWYNVIRSLCAIPMMYLSARVVRRFGALKTLAFSVFVMGLGELAFSLSASTFAILAIGVVLGLNSGLLMVSQVFYAQELAPPELQNTVQMLRGTTLALSVIIASTLIGSLIDITGAGVRTYFHVSALIVTATVVLFVCINRALAARQAKDAARENITA